MAVRDNTKAGNSVKQTSSVLRIRGCVHLPLQQVFKIIMSPDSTFYKLNSDIYFAKVLSLAIRVRTIFRKTLLKKCNKHARVFTVRQASSLKKWRGFRRSSKQKMLLCILSKYFR